jgi:hypothetical protein
MFGPSRRVARRTARRTARRQAYFRDAMEPEPEYEQPAPPPAAAAPAPDMASQLAELAKLKEQGALSEEEFEAAKRKILGT